MRADDFLDACGARWQETGQYVVGRVVIFVPNGRGRHGAEMLKFSAAVGRAAIEAATEPKENP